MYTSYADLLKDVEVNKKIKYNQLILFSGKVGELTYRKKVTTFGRLRVSKIIKADIDSIHDVLEKPLDRINGGSAARLMVYLSQFPDYIERVNELQKYCLRLVSRAGVVQFDFDSLYADTNTQTYEDIKKISKDKNLSDPQKVLMMTEKYKEYVNEIKGNISDEVKEDIKYANRVKLDSLVDIVAPAFIMSGVKEVPLINDSSLFAGMGEKSYRDHAVENRSLQSLKVSGVPKSGYLTRQVEFLMNDFTYQEGSDDKNKGILIPRYRSEGRTAPDGSVYPRFRGTPNESDRVPVRSIISKSKQDGRVTPDLISTLYTDFTVNAAVGISFATSITQAITQKSLSLRYS